MSLLTDEVRAWIGREVTYEAPEELGRASIRAFARAVGDDNPLYTDEAFARAHGHPSVIAPPTLICETNQFIVRPPDADGYSGHLWELPITGCRLIRGGNAYTFARPVLPTDRITVRWRLASIEERSSSAGKGMLIVTSVVTYTDQSGEQLAENTETMIYEETS